MGIHATAGLQCSSALPSHLVSWKEDGGWEEMKVPSDPSILNQLGTSLPWDRKVCWSMRGLKTGKKRFSLPWGLWTLHSFLLISLKVEQAKWSSVIWMLVFQNFCSCASLVKGSMILKHCPNLHHSYLREQQHDWETFMCLSAKTS